MISINYNRFFFSPDAAGAGGLPVQLKDKRNSLQVIHIEELQKANTELKQARRAALNLMEDAILSKEALKQSEERMRWQKEVFRSIVDGASLADSLDLIARMVIEETKKGVRTAFYIADSSGTRLHPVMHAGNMSPLYLAEIDGFILGKDAPACGLSVPAGQPRLTADVFEDPLWEPCLHLARKYDYRACWSFPIKTKDQNVVGTFAMYFHQPRPATEQDIALADVATRTAAMVIASYEETHQKEIAKEALLKSEERMRVTLESATDYAIITLNRERMIESWSSGASLLFGYTEAEIIGRSADIIFTKEDRAAGVPEKEMITAKETGRAADNRWHLRKDGSRFFVNGMMCPIYDQVQRLSGYVKVASDMTQQQLFTEELHRLVSERTTELQRSNEDLMQFAHVASHDMKEPARKIQTFANRILNEFGDTMPDKMRTYLDKIGSATNRMYNMINGVLNYSKISNPGQLIEMVDLNLVISEIMTDLEVLIQQKQAQISSKELPEIPGYKLLLYQLFYNLILNALKFAKAGEPAHIEITCRIVQKDKSRFYQVDVADNGIGFEQEYAASIFETFTRLNSADEYEGTGLGLALCRRIVDRHHGFISATGQPGKGAVFTILLPENEPPVKAGT